MTLAPRFTHLSLGSTPTPPTSTSINQPQHSTSTKLLIVTLPPRTCGQHHPFHSLLPSSPLSTTKTHPQPPCPTNQYGTRARGATAKAHAHGMSPSLLVSLYPDTRFISENDCLTSRQSRVHAQSRSDPQIRPEYLSAVLPREESGYRFH